MEFHVGWVIAAFLTRIVLGVVWAKNKYDRWKDDDD